MTLYTLLFGRTKKKMSPIMVDSKVKCEQYMTARTANNGEKGCGGWHKIEVAPKDAKVWRQKSATRGGNKCQIVARIGERAAGYISKRGFNHHT